MGGAISDPGSGLVSNPGRCALVIGANGQDGYYLCDQLEARGYRVQKVTRDRLLDADGHGVAFNLLDRAAVRALISRDLPDEIYYLAAHHHSSQDDPGTLSELADQSFATHCLGLTNVLEAMTTAPDARLFYASSALVFGNPDAAPQTETTPLRPICVYGVTKVAGMGLIEVYRRERGVMACSGILFNHESRRRSTRFVSRKIVAGAVDIHLGHASSLTLASLDAKVDWGAAEDYTRAMQLMLTGDAPQDYVIASGKLNTIRQFAARAFARLDLDYEKFVREQPGLVQRPSRHVPLLGNPQRLEAERSWRREIPLERMIDNMVDCELRSRR